MVRIASEASSYVLIIDQDGAFGFQLAKELLVGESVIFVGAKKQSENAEGLTHITYAHSHKHIPRIPDVKLRATYIVWQGEKELLSLLPQFLTKAKQEEGVVYFLVPPERYNVETITRLSELYKNLYIMLLGEVFSQSAIYEIKTSIGRLLHFATQGKIVLSDQGLKRMFPLFAPDAIALLSTFPYAKQKGGIYNFFPAHPPTQASVSRVLQKHEPLIRIDYAKTKATELPLAAHKNTVGTYVFPESYSWQERITQTYDALAMQKKPEVIVVKKKGKRLKMLFGPLILFGISFLFLPLLATVLFSLFGVWQLSLAKDVFEANNNAAARTAIVRSQQSFMLSRITAELLVSEAGAIGHPELAQTLLEEINTGQEVTALLLSGIEASGQLQRVFQGTSSNPQEDVIAASNTFKSLLVAYEKLKQENKLPKEIIAKLDGYTPVMKQFVQSENVLPFLLGLGGEKKYAVLFQNNMELRPGGGFIGSYAMLTVKDSRIVAFTIHDVYDADGQLKGHIEPPFQLRRYLPQAHWYLRDSNFSFSSAKNAQNASYLLAQEVGEKVDGVITADVTLLQSLLSVVGPVRVPEYNETVTAENMYLLTQSHAEKDFFPGSTQKKDFLRSLFVALQTRLTTDKKISYPQLAKAIQQAILEKHLLVAVENERAQQALVVNGLSSTIAQVEQQSATINDFLGIVEANVGANKANYYVKRKVKQEVTIAENGGVLEKTSVYYKNTSTGQWPGGDYKEYFRIVLPQGATVTDITIDGVSQETAGAVTDAAVYEAAKFVPSSKLEVEKTEEEGRAVYGFLVIVPINQLKTVTVSYALPTFFPLQSEKASYALSLFKQPGQTSDPYSLLVHVPSGWQVLDVQRPSDGMLTKASDTVVYDGKLANDFQIRIAFAKK